jgi:hypothetical protein
VPGCIGRLIPFDQSIAYETLLLELDEMHGGLFPATDPVAGIVTRLHRRTEARLVELAHLGADRLTIELILARFEDIGLSQSRDPPHQRAHNCPHIADGSAHSRSIPWSTPGCKEQTGTHPDGHPRTRRGR